MAKDGTTGPVSNMDGGTFKSSEEVRMEDARDLSQSEAIIDILGEGLGKLLVDAGFVTIRSIQTATDEDLSAISGIGKAKLAEIREASVGTQSLAALTPEELVPAPDIPEVETPDEAVGIEDVEAPAPDVVEPAPEMGGSLEVLDEAFEREAGLPAEEAETVPEPEGSLASSVIFDNSVDSVVPSPADEDVAARGLGIIDDSVVPSPADLEALGDIIPELADLVVGPAEPIYVQEDEDILPELADLEVGPPAQPGVAMMPTVVEPLGVSTRIARIQQTADEQAVEDARVAEAVRKNAIEQAEKEADRATDEAEEAIKETRVAEVSEVVGDAPFEHIQLDEDALARRLAELEGEVAGDAPPENIQPEPQVFGEGTVDGAIDIEAPPEYIQPETQEFGEGTVEEAEKSGDIIQKVQEMEANLEPKGGPLSIPPDVADAIVEEPAEVGELGTEEVGGPEPDKSEEPTSE